ncbi:MAG: DRTGG domain-containing protein [Dehalococcoidia bacterium]
MPTLLVASPTSLSGKTTVAVAIGRALRRDGVNASFERRGDGADADRRTFAALSSSSGDTHIVELAAGDATQVAGARILVIATPETADEASAMARAASEALAGVILNRAPARDGEAGSDYVGVAPLLVIPEDRILAAPTLAVVAAALEAETENLEENALLTLDEPVIASIAADPGQAYFDRTRASSVIVRSDKPDLQLAALNAGAECMIITGGLPLLSYVRDRVAADEIPLLTTALDTTDAVKVIEGLYGAAPFAASEEKLKRLDALFAGFGAAQLFAATS